VIKLITPLPRQVSVAVSGGPDSMAALDFICRGGRDVRVLHFDHGTQHATTARAFLEAHCRVSGLDLVVSGLRRERGPKESLEEYWRTERIRFFREQSGHGPIVTAHHLDDAVEWWIFTSLHGAPRVMPTENPETGVIRPFLATEKSALLDWCEKKGVPYVDDPSNNSRDHMRNRVRHDIVPQALLVNPGLKKVVRKKISGSHANLGEVV